MSNRAISVDPMPNSSNDDVMNCIADSEEITLVKSWE